LAKTILAKLKKRERAKIETKTKITKENELKCFALFQ
jgi:hypothetical protein